MKRRSRSRKKSKSIRRMMRNDPRATSGATTDTSILSGAGQVRISTFPRWLFKTIGETEDYKMDERNPVGSLESYCSVKDCPGIRTFMSNENKCLRHEFGGDEYYVDKHEELKTIASEPPP